MSWSLTGLREMELWAAKLWKQLNDEIWWKNWISTDENNIIQKKTELTTSKGYKIIFGLQPRITGAGVTGDAMLEGSEDSMAFYGDSVTIQQYRNAVVWPGAYWVQKVPFDVKKSMTTALRVWGHEKHDGLFFSAFLSSFSQTNNVTVGQEGTSIAYVPKTLGDDNLLSIGFLRKLPYLAKSFRIRPVLSGGRKYYVFLMHDQAAYELQASHSTTLQTWYQTMLYARERDKDNPLFTGGLGMVGGGDRSVVLHSHNNANLRGIGTTTYPVTACYSLLLGAQAGLYAVAEESWLTEKKFDYGNKYGLATGFMVGVRKSMFNGAEYGCMRVMHYSPPL